MSELTTSIEKSVIFLRGRYPQGHPLLTSLERRLEYLTAKQQDAEKGGPAKNRMKI